MKTAQLIGFEDFDDFTLQKVREYVQPLINRYKRIFGLETIQEFKVVTDTIHKVGGKDEYEVIGHLNTTHGLFKVKRNGWEILDVINEVIENLDRQIIEAKEKKVKTKRRYPANA